jgi:hypothetical protein
LRASDSSKRLFVLEIKLLESLSEFNDWLSLRYAITESFVMIMKRWVVPMLSQQISSGDHTNKLLCAVLDNWNAPNCMEKSERTNMSERASKQTSA